MRHPPSRLFAALARLALRAALRAVITVLIFLTCMTAALACLGVPLPSPSELLERFESVSQLAKILS